MLRVKPVAEGLTAQVPLIAAQSPVAPAIETVRGTYVPKPRLTVKSVLAPPPELVAPVMEPSVCPAVRRNATGLDLNVPSVYSPLDPTVPHHAAVATTS